MENYTIIAGVKLIGLFFFLTVLSLSPPAYAGGTSQKNQLSLDLSWCLTEDLYSNSKTAYVPDGAIVKIGPYYFRLCQGATEGSDPHNRTLRFFYNPEVVEGLQLPRVMRGLIINSRQSWEDRIVSLTVGRQKATVFDLPSLSYQRFLISPSQGKSASPNSVIYYFDNQVLKNIEHIPPHIFQCNKEISTDFKTGGRCMITIGYGEVFATLLLLGAVEKEGKIDVAQFPVLAKAMHTVISYADVSADLDQVPSDIPVLD